MQNKTCIVSVAFRNPYVQHMVKQRSFIARDNPNTHVLFFRDRLPGRNIIHEEDIVTRFQESLYGFKPHAIQMAIDEGYKKIIWLDPSVLPTASIDILTESLETNPMIVRIGDAPIAKMCSQKAKDWFEVKDSELEGVKHIGGTVYGFNFNNPKVVETFNLWKQAEEAGIFGTQDEFMAGHWADEACMVLAMYNNEMPQYWEEKFTYYNMKNGI